MEVEVGGAAVEKKEGLPKPEEISLEVNKVSFFFWRKHAKRARAPESCGGAGPARRRRDVNSSADGSLRKCRAVHEPRTSRAQAAHKPTLLCVSLRASNERTPLN